MIARIINLFHTWRQRRVSQFKPSIRVLGTLFGFGMVLSFALSACNPTPNANSASTPSSALNQPKLTVLKMGHQKGMALLNVLKAQGNLEKRLQPQGISVTWNEFSSTAPLLEGLASGGIVFGGGGGTGSVFAQASDKPFVRVAASTSGTRSSAILTREDSSLKTLADLKGKKVGFAKGSSSQYMIVKALEKVGLKYSDIQPVFLTPAEAYPAFERGDLDAWLIWDPYTAEAEHKLKTRFLADNSDVFGEKAPTESPAFYYAAPDFVRDRPELVKVILEELGKVGQWSRENVNDSAKLLSDVYKIDVETMKVVEARGGTRQVLPVTDEVLGGLQRMADTFADLKVIPKKIDVKDKNFNWNADKA